MKYIVGVIVLILVINNVQVSNSARILAFIPTPSYSHQTAFHELWKGLCKKGHEIVFVTCSDLPPLKLTNFTQINIKEEGTPLLSTVNFMEMAFGSSFISVVEEIFFKLSMVFAKMIFEDPRVRKLYDPGSNEKFDLIMAEMFLAPSMYGFAHRFNAPLIGLASLRLDSFNHYALGDVVLTSHPSLWEINRDVGINLSFWQRLKNFVGLWRHIYVQLRDHTSVHEKLMRDHLGSETPSIHELHKMTSLVFVNQDEKISYARPQLPKIIPFTHFHVSNTPPPLPQSIQAVLNDTEEFIYFNLGSNMRSSTLPAAIQQMFLEVFAKMPCKVLWKYETELPRKSNNIYTAKWFPQQSILAHPKIKFFISHGGLQGTQEAIHYGVPILVLPIFADQFHQARKLEQLRAGRYLEITTLTKEQAHDAVNDLFTNSSYKENMIKLKNLLEDKPYDTVSHLVWWTEYVIRHKGAPHLHSVSVEQPWYQRQDIDVIAFTAILAFTFFTLTLIITVEMCQYMLRYLMKYRMRSKAKVN